MEKQILKYEKFIAQEAKQELSAEKKEQLIKLHNEMLKNFQKKGQFI